MRTLSVNVGINDGNDHDWFHWLPHFQWNNVSTPDMTIKGLTVSWGVFVVALGYTKAKLQAEPTPRGNNNEQT